MKSGNHPLSPLFANGGETLNGAGSGARRLRPVIPEQWIWHFRILTGLRSRLMEDRGTQIAEAAEPIDVDTESADSATDEFDRDLALAMWESRDDLLQEVDAAILRIRDGTYGFCEETGKVIPAARLLAMPWTRYTIEAEQKLEAGGQKPGPRIRRLYPFAPLGERNDNHVDEVDERSQAGSLDPDQITASADDTP